MVLPSKVTEYVTFPEAVISAFTLPSGEARVQDFCAPREIKGMHNARTAAQRMVFSFVVMVIQDYNYYSSYPKFFLHCPEEVEGLERSHVVEVGRSQLVPEGFQGRIVQLEEGKLQRAVAL